MKSRETALRLKRFEADEKARKVANLADMIREFEIMASDLDRQVKAEEERTGIKDPAHFAYSTFAKSAGQRRNNLLASVAELKEKHAAAARDRDEAAESVTRASSGPEARPGARPRRRGDRPASMDLR